MKYSHAMLDWRSHAKTHAHLLRRCLGILFLMVLLCSTATMYGGIPYYVECGGSSGGNGLSEDHPFNNLDSLAGITFQPGDVINFAYGSTCQETTSTIFSPHGSGTAAAPIVIKAYSALDNPSATTLPVIDGTDPSDPTQPNAVMKLQNQQYWEVNNIELDGGSHYGLYVENTTSTDLNHLHFSGLIARKARFQSIQRGDSGEVFITSSSSGKLNDVLVAHVTAGNTTVSEGIYIQAGGANVPSGNTNQGLGNNIIVQDSLVHDVYGDGILVVTAQNATLENNVVYKSGMCGIYQASSSCGTSTPGGLWEWYCVACTIQNNESYENNTFGTGDGGDFDIDASNTANIVQYNYGHDAMGYCVMLYSANGRVDLNNIIRYNICSNNERRMTPYNEGEIYLKSDSTSTSHSYIDGGQIYNNTIYWNPARTDRYAILSIHADYTGATEPTIFKNNIIYSNSNGNMLWTDANGSLKLDNNIYWTSGVPPAWGTGEDDSTSGNPAPATIYNTFVAYQATGMEPNSKNVDPLLNCPVHNTTNNPATGSIVFPGASPNNNLSPFFTLQQGSPALGAGAIIIVNPGVTDVNGGLDFFGNLVPQGTPPNIGAYAGPAVPKPPSCPPLSQ